MSEQYFFVRKLGLGKEVVSLSLCGNGGISGRRNEMMKTGGWFANILKKDLEGKKGDY